MNFNHLMLSFSTSWFAWMKALLALMVIWLCGFFIRRVVFYYLSRWAKKTETQADDIIIAASRVHMLLWFFLLGLSVAIQLIPGGHAHKIIINRIISSLFVVSLTFLAAQVSSGLITLFARNSLSLPFTSLTQNLIRLVVVGIGMLILLSNLGISIAPLLTALGVGSLAVALALQDTLSNLFAGFYILANKQIRPGDYIRLDSGQEGNVIDIGWRSTRIRELSNNIILVPNAKVGTAIVTNFNLPGKELYFGITMGVSYDSDLEKVERVAIEVASQVMAEVPGGISDFSPAVRFNKFGDSSIDFSISFQAREFVDKYLLTHEFIKRLHKRFRAENITIPFPQRVVHIAGTDTKATLDNGH